MALGCGSKFSKFILVVLNIILSILALAMISCGIYVLVMVNKYVTNGEWYGIEFGVIQVASGILIGVGAVILFICWLGCCGAMNENTGCLICYAVIVFCLVILQIIAFIMAVVFYSKVNSGLHDTLTNTLTYNYSIYHDTPATQSWDYIQSNLQCCGVNSPIDWKSSDWKKNVSKVTNVPTSCCIANSTGVPLDETLCQQFAYSNTTQGSNYIYNQGCLLKIESASRPQLIWFVCVILSVIFLQVLLGIFACCLNSSIKNSYEKV